MQEQLDRIEFKQDRLTTLILGDGEKVEGIVPRLTSLERDKRRMSKVLGGLIAAVATILGPKIWDWLTSRTHI